MRYAFASFCVGKVKWTAFVYALSFKRSATTPLICTLYAFSKR